MIRPTIVAAAVLLATLAACGGSSSGEAPASEVPKSSAVAPSPAATSPASAERPDEVESLADALKAKVPELTDVRVYTEDNDPNDLIGRPNGYEQAALIFYGALEDCDKADPGIDCGTVIEIWPSADKAEGRKDYIQGVLDGGGILGSEYDYVVGAQLLRVSGQIKPSEAKAIEAAWKDLG